MVRADKIDSRQMQDIVGLSPAQEGMLQQYLQHPESDVFCERLTVRLRGSVEWRAFVAAWRHVTLHNDPLRTLFRWDNVARPLQLILKVHEPYVEKLPSGEAIPDWHPDLRRVPFRVVLRPVEKQSFDMRIDFHHIILDGWSSGILLTEFFEAYDAISGGRPPEILEKPCFKDYLHLVRQQDTAAQKRFWEECFAGFPHTASNRRFARRGFQPGFMSVQLSGDVVKGLEQFNRRNKTADAAVFYTAWGLTLADMSQSMDVAFDTTVSGRSLPLEGIERMTGLLINTIPLRLTVDQNDSLRSAVLGIRDVLSQRQSFETTSRYVIHQAARGRDRLGTTHTLMVVENYPLDQKLSDPNRPLRIEGYEIVEKTLHDIAVMIEARDGFQMGITYDPVMFTEKEISLLAGRFNGIVNAIIAEGETPVKQILESGESLAGAFHTLRDATFSQGPGPPPPAALPRDDLEQALAELFATILQKTPADIGLDLDFFACGGHSLQASALAAGITERFNVKLPLPDIFRYPTIRRLASRLRRGKEDAEPAIPVVPTPARELYPCSSAQKRLYFIWQMDTAQTAYNAPVQFTITGELDVPRLRRSVAELIQRHEALRTSFELVDGAPVQRIHDHVEFQIESLDRDSFLRPFDLGRPPLMRAALTSSGNRHELLVDIHHIVCDGTSRDIVVADLAALMQGQTPECSRFQYRDFCVWQTMGIEEDHWRKQRDYWLRRLSPLPQQLNVPLDVPRATGQALEGKRRRFTMPEQSVVHLDLLRERFGLTRFMACHAVLAILLSKYCRVDDVVVGTAVSGRHHREFDHVVGLFMETLALRSAPAAGKTVAVFLKEIQTLTWEAFENQLYPFRNLLLDVAIDGGSRNPLFDVMLIVQNHQRRSLRLPGLEVQTKDLATGVAKVDLTWEVYEEQDGIDMEVEYCSTLLSEDTVRRMWGHWLHVLEQVARQPAASIGSIQLADNQEVQRILEQFNSPRDFPEAVIPVHEQLVGVTNMRPDATALTSECHNWLSYLELQRRASSLAAQLRRRGVRAGDLVALLMERSPQLMVSILAILKAGAAYVPLDPAYPPERVIYILADSATPFILTDEENQSRVPSSANAVVLTAGLPEQETGSWDPSPVDDCDAAYVIYTSGSTGRPKGVVVEHRNLEFYIASFRSRLPMGRRDITLQQASITFDASCEEIWPLLLAGGRLLVASKDSVRDVSILAELICRFNVTVIDCSPLLLGELNRRPHHQLRSLRLIVNGGDVLKREHIDRLLEVGQVVNTYGPTETTICATYQKLSGEVMDPIPIGSPFPGYRVVIRDDEGHILPVGVPGELCITGGGVARGYLNSPEATQRQFGPSRMYRSGDLALWMSNGHIRFLGRCDRQVKIRGYRIEPAEIETCLATEPSVAQAAVVPRTDDGREPYLCAYLTATSGEELDIPRLRRFLARLLPDYMIPERFVALDRLPLTAGGKLDMRALPKPTDLTSGRHTEHVEARNETEREISAVLRDVLNIEKIGVRDDFFQLGGNSILANRAIAGIRDAMGGEISLRSFFEAPTVAGLAQRVKRDSGEGERIPRASRHQDIPLSYPQERIWFLQQLDGDNNAYIIPRALRVRGMVDPELFERCLTEIVRRHEILRTQFVLKDGRPVQRVRPPFTFSIPVLDLSGESSQRQRLAIEEFIVSQGNHPFDLKQGPLLRMHLLKLSAEEHVLVSVEHHLIHDGWTQGVLLREFFALYRAFREGRPSPLPEPPIQYADFAVWQRNYMAGARLERHIDFWRRKLEGLSPLLDLPLDFPRPPKLRGKGGMERLVIPAGLVTALRNFSQERGTTLFMTMLAVFKILLFRYTGCTDLCVGSGVADRRRKELEGMLGMVINTVALRTEIHGAMSVADCLRAVKTTCLESYEYQDAPFDHVVDAVSSQRSLSYMPIFQVMFSFMDTPTRRLELPGLEFQVERSHNQSSKFDLNLVAIPPRDGDELGGEILLDWEYNSDLFKPATMKSMMRRFKNLLDWCVRQPEICVSRLPLLEDAERQDLLATFNDTAADYPRRLSIPALFARQAQLAPDSVCVLEDNGSVTYRFLEQRAGGWARRLKDLGIQEEEVVAIMARRSIDMLAATLGILGAGAAYLPIARDFPTSRKRFMLADASVRFLLHEGEADDLPGCRQLSLTEPSAGLRFGDHIHGLPSERLAYIMYTSGSTGAPKGVMISHRNVARLVKPFVYASAEQGDRCLPTCRIEFDGSTFEIWGGLLNRIPLCLTAEETVLDAHSLKQALLRHGVTYMLMTVALFNQVSEADIEVFGPLRTVLMGGEALSPAHINRLRRQYPQISILNAYGPTENATFSTTFQVDREYGANIPIGRPIANSSAFILDSNLDLQPMGVFGELWLGGDGLARGYLNRPELTAERFVDMPAPLGRLYRSGDRGRVLAGGILEFAGRVDRQVKIRGFRVEPEEVAEVLKGHEAVTDAVVEPVRDQHGELCLCAYYTAAAELEDSALGNFLARRLPRYMVPDFVKRLDVFPMTSNGKIDRKRLGPVTDKWRSGDTKKISPRTRYEKMIANVWQAMLGAEDIGLDDNFFDLGGNSLKIIKVNQMMNRELGMSIPVVKLFEFPTVRLLAAYCGGGEEEDSAEEEIPVGEKEAAGRTMARRQRMMEVDDE